MEESKGQNNTISFMGASLSTGNMGVSALCASFVKIVKTLQPDIDVLLFIGRNKPEIQHLKLINQDVRLGVVNHRLSPKASLNEHLLWIFFLSCLQKIVFFPFVRNVIIQRNEFINEMNRCQFVASIFGGDSFSDIYGKSRLIFSALPSIVAILLGKKLVLLPQTYGPFNSLISKRIAKIIINRAYRIYSRDRQGLVYINQFLNKKRLNHKTPIFCPDVAFMLDAITPESINIQPPMDSNTKHPIIGINVNGLMYNGGYTKNNMFGLNIDYKRLIQNIIENLVSVTNAQILLVPHTFGPKGNVNSDPDACLKILGNLDDTIKHRVFMVNRNYNQSELKGIIKLCEFFIGSRMHSCIAALSQGIPTIGIAYSKKFVGVFDSVGVGDSVLDARRLGEQEIIERIIDQFHRRNDLKPEITAHVSAAKEKISAEFSELLNEFTS